MLEKIFLTVAEAIRSDVGKSIARLSNSDREKISIEIGDTIEITGKKRTVATVRAGASHDENIQIIRIDGISRANADTTMGDKVEVRKIDCSSAESITLSPTQAVSFSDDPTDYFHTRLLNKPFLKNQKCSINVMGTHLYYIITKLNPGDCVKVTENTNVIISDKVVEKETLHLPDVSYEDIGGLKKEIDLIREMVEVPMKHPEVFQRLGISAPKGVLLTGPPGTGKTLLAKAVASETDSQFYSIAGPEIMSKFYGESEKQLREIFEEANKNAPSIIFIDEIDSIAPKRGGSGDQTEKRVVAQLLTSMDGLQARNNVIVMAATNRQDDIDEALRRPGRFDRKIKIMPPDQDGRKEILQIHTRGMPLNDDVELDILANKTIGYTGADLEMLCKEAAIKALSPYMEGLKKYSLKVPTTILENLKVTMQHFMDALTIVEPSAMREVLTNKPNVKWTDIGGLEDTKRQLKETIELPLKNPVLFRKAGIKSPKGVMLYGPPGTGKTLLAKAIANESDANFISVKGPELISKWVGESEKHIREIFQRARQVAPTVIFFDEFDSISKVRGNSLSDSTERMVNQLLSEIDGVEELEKVTIIAATNRIDLIDEALLRPGRFEIKIEIPLPDEKSRLQILTVHTKDMPLEKGIHLGEYAEKSEGWSGADVQSICRRAGLNAIRECTSKKSTDVTITPDNFNAAFLEIKNQKKVGKLPPIVL